jgi:hypothetical protein
MKKDKQYTDSAIVAAICYLGLTIGTLILALVL